MAKTRVTKQKKVILKILQETTSHPTADWIYEEARKVLPDISLGTVYRNLRILTETGAIQELNYGSSYSRYDGNPVNHYHFVCHQCNRVLDIPMPVISDLETRVEDITGHQVDHHRTEFYGTCQDCLEGDGRKEEA
ncbi:MAG: transcriptional repressor [Clostridia bacterium]|nr:transcriptional repressor [Clostridia bacterium]